MATTPVIVRSRLVPKVLEDLGYWSKEYQGDHTVSFGYKEQEIAAFFPSDEVPERGLEAMLRHFIRMVGNHGGKEA